MKICNYLVFLCLLTYYLPSFGQLPANAVEIAKIYHDASSFTTDRLGNSYLYNENFIWLYNQQGDSIAAFNSRKYGEIAFVDATDPYKILVFFNDYNLLVFLDNYLSVNAEPIELEKLGFDQISMACTSRGGGVWIFDAIKQKAVHLNDNFIVDKQTVNLSQWFGSRIEPNFMLEYNNQLFINEFATGIYQFDHFGTFQKKIELSQLNSFQRMNEDLHYVKDNNFCKLTIPNLEEICTNLNPEIVAEIRIEKDRMYLFSKKFYRIFSMK